MCRQDVSDNIYVPKEPSGLAKRELISIIRQYEEMLAVLDGRSSPGAALVKNQLREGLEVVIDELKQR